jgi:predicted ribosomally synthesized peptide with SipW-like signal peptide
MKNKLVKASLAGVAAIAIAAGGSTYAAWSDFDTITGNHVGADKLSLKIGQANTQSLDNLKLAPGGQSDYEWVVASREGETVPAAALTLSLTNLVGTEDGCTSTSSELAADPDCGVLSSGGEFTKEALVNVLVSKPTTDLAHACDLPRGSRLVRVPMNQVAAGAPIDLLGKDSTGAPITLAKGEGICTVVTVTLPKDTATNASQGDSATFDLRFDLTQA